MWISRRWVAVTLVASVFLNLLLVGVGVGRYLAETRGPFLRGGRALVTPARVRALPEAERARYRATTGSHRAAIMAARQVARAARLRVQDDIAAPQFDRARLEADLASLREAAMHVEIALHAALVDAVEDLPPPSRAALVAGEDRQAAPAR